MTGPGFIHLHVHSAYSLLEGRAAARQAARAGQGRQAAGARHRRHQQPVRRARILREGGGEGHPAAARRASWRSISAPPRTGRSERSHDRGHFGKGGVVLIAGRSTTGFANLSRLVSRAYLEGENGRPRRSSTGSTATTLEGIICLSGGPEGAIDPYLRERPRRAGDAPARSAARAVRRPLLCRAAAPWAARRRPLNRSAS